MDTITKIIQRIGRYLSQRDEFRIVIFYFMGVIVIKVIFGARLDFFIKTSHLLLPFQLKLITDLIEFCKVATF